jgi:hypothetical protein
MNRLFASLLISSTLAFGATAHAAECYEITGWTSTDYIGADALVTPTSCAVTPSGTAWLNVTISYGAGPIDDLWLRILLSDSHMSGTTFSPLLVFAMYDGAGLPIVTTDAIVGPYDNEMDATVNPPSQGNIRNRARVRLRHRNTGHCLETGSTNGSAVANFPCADYPDQIFELVYAGAGSYRLQNESDNQCVYTLPADGSTVHSWGCWDDPGMRFRFIPQDGGFRLHNLEEGQCIYGNPSYGGDTHSWGCWSDPAMVYQVDIVEYAPTGPIGPHPVRRERRATSGGGVDSQRRSDGRDDGREPAGRPERSGLIDEINEGDEVEL